MISSYNEWSPLKRIVVGSATDANWPVNEYDAKAGKYTDPLPAMATEAKLPTQQMPMAPAPSPFVIKSSAGGER